MKALLTLALALSTQLVSAQVIENEEDDTTVTYHVRGGGSNKALLMRVFGAVKKLEEAKHAGGSRTMTVRQRMSPTEFLMNMGGHKEYWFIAIEGQNWKNLEKVRVDYERTGATKTFLNESGEKIELRVLKQVKSKPGPEFTKDEFIRRLKEGGGWLLRDFEKRKCEVCGGDGRVQTDTDLEDCNECLEGTITIDYMVEW
jgi:hypothetical protein